MYTLVGKQKLDFVDKGTGEVVRGVKLHYTCPDDRVAGRAVDTRFIRQDSGLFPKADVLQFGDFSFVYGPRNRVEDIIQELKEK